LLRCELVLFIFNILGLLRISLPDRYCPGDFFTWCHWWEL